MKKVITRVQCNCGWEKWNQYPLEMTDEEILDIDTQTLKDHHSQEHEYQGGASLKHTKSTKTKIN